MSDFPTLSDPITTWADVRPTHRPLDSLRGKVSDAWEKYFYTCDRYQDGECKFEHVEFMRLKAEALEASYKRKYDELNAIPPQECACSLPEQVCDVCRKRGNDDNEIPY